VDRRLLRTLGRCGQGAAIIGESRERHVSEEGGCLGRAFRVGCGFVLCLLLTAGAVALYRLWTAPAHVPGLTTEERATAAAKLAGVERSLRSGRSFETRFSEAELTFLAQQYLNRERIGGDVSVTLPEDDLQISFRTTVDELERFVKLDQLPSWMGSEVRGALRVHLSIAHNEPYAELESVSLYGVPVPLGLLGSAAKGNWFQRLDADSAAVIRRIRSLKIHDGTLFVTSG
jgi:hypothetical protein